jgi:carboxyl-terminal processing protease
MKDSFFKGLCVGCFATLIGTLSAITITDNTGFLTKKDVNKINSLYKSITSEYYEEVDEDDMKDAILHSMFESLDQYSDYYNQEEYEDLTTSKDDFCGIGVYMQQRSYDLRCQILKVYDNSPASKAGLQEKDIILKVDDTDISKLQLDEISDMVRGTKGTDVTLEILRGDNTYTYTITRDEVKSIQTGSKVLSDKTGYIQILSFDGSVDTDFSADLEKMRDAGVENIIIDLRDNGGGYVDKLMNILNQIVPNNLVTYTLNKDGDRYEYHTENDLKDLEFNYVILTNENTASCSEIMTGMMKCYGYATIIGTKTYGKGVVQTLVEINGEAYKLTTDTYYLPDDSCINEQGITPDIIDEDTDNQINRALEILEK